MAADGGDTVLYPEDLFSVCDLVESEFLSHLGANLRGVSVDGLAASYHDVNIADLLDGGGEGIGCGKSIGSGEKPVS